MRKIYTQFTETLDIKYNRTSQREIMRREIDVWSFSGRFRALKSAVINVDRRRGSRGSRERHPHVHQDDSSSSCGTCIRARLTLARHKFMQNNSTTTVHYGVDGAGSKTLPEPRVLRSSSARIRAPRSSCSFARGPVRLLAGN